MNDAVKMWERMRGAIAARCDRQKAALADTELQLKAADEALEEARHKAAQGDLIGKPGVGAVKR